jgi:regulator of protease activity HflC (stomatin/prohibitin superfamily)
MDTKSYICIGTCVTISLVVILLLVSMDSIEPLQYGITYNRVTKAIGTEVYENGRYLIGPLNSFFEYPANLVTIEFSDQHTATAEALQTRTAEGLGISLHVAFQFQIIKADIPKLYSLANINYFGTYVRISRDVILKIAGMYNAGDYWVDRQKIGDHMLDALDKELSKAFAKVITLQILKIDLPDSYEDSIVQTQVEVQKTNMRKFEQTAELIRQNISVIRSEAEQQIKITNSTATAEAYKVKQFAHVNHILNIFRLKLLLILSQLSLMFIRTSKIRSELTQMTLINTYS